MPDDLAEPVVTAACILSTGGPWVRPSPGIPCALYLIESGMKLITRALMCRESEISYSAVMPRAGGHPVHRGFSINQKRLWNTGFPACAGNDIACDDTMSATATNGRHSLFLQRLREPLRHHAPIRCRQKSLQQVHEAGIVADKDARLVALDAPDDAQRRIARRGLGKQLEPLDRLDAPRIVGHVANHTRVACDRRRDAARMHHRQPDIALRRLELMPQAFGEAAYCELRSSVG